MSLDSKKTEDRPLTSLEELLEYFRSAERRDGLAGLRGFPGATGDISFSARRTPEKELFFLTADRDGVRELTRAELNAGPAGAGAGGP